jgi:serine/threonine-protein kinase RsbW
MTPEAKHLEVVLDTHVESVNLAEEMCLRVAEAVGFNEDECYRIGMSVREGVINAFHYGNQEKPEKKIHLVVDLTREKMIIHVMDEGKGFRLEDVPDPLAEENLLSTSGRGIFLMRTFMDEFDVVSGRTGGAEIIMSKKIPTPGSPSSNGNGGASSAAPQQEAQEEHYGSLVRDDSRSGHNHDCGFERAHLAWRGERPPA